MTIARRCSAIVLATVIASAAASAADWPQWRGSDRNGIAPSSPALATNWPATGPVLAWKSEKIPTYNDGGLGSVAVSKGLAVIYSNWKYKDPIDGDFIWVLDMMEDLAVFPHNLATSSPLVVNDLVYIVTSNGVEKDHITIPSPRAPSFIAVNKLTVK